MDMRIKSSKWRKIAEYAPETIGDESAMRRAWKDIEDVDEPEFDVEYSRFFAENVICHHPYYHEKHLNQVD